MVILLFSMYFSVDLIYIYSVLNLAIQVTGHDAIYPLIDM